MDFVQKAGSVDSTQITNTPPVAVQETVVVTPPQNSAPEVIKNKNPIGTFDDLVSTDKYYTAITYFAKK
ncbi:MAG: hypothetical protein WCK88_03645 [bacterium]